MILVTQLRDTGIQVGLFRTVDQVDLSTLVTYDVPSEHYLRVLDQLVGDWSHIEAWYTRVDAESFTSIRGLVALINTLAPLNTVPVYVFRDDIQSANMTELPLVPAYSAEPNIGTRN